MKKIAQTYLEQSWVDPNWLTALLTPFSWLYGAIIYSRKYAYQLGVFKTYRAPVPVVVVGNISVGGTGKTPLVIHLVEHLAARGFRPGVISRGYGGQAEEYPLFVDASTPVTACGDEPALIARKTSVPVMVGADRAQSVELLCKQYGVDLIVADDGLQHLALERDIEICVVDGKRAANNHRLLPAGPNREPQSKQQQVDFLVVNGSSVTDSGEQAIAMQLEAGLPRSVRSEENLGFDHSDGVHAVAAIGNPQRFFDTCAGLGWQVIPHAFPDHHRYAQRDIDFDDGLPIVMTEKDAVKCEAFADDRHWVLPVSVKLGRDIVSLIIERLRKK